MVLSEKSDRQFWNEHSVDGSPQTPLHNGKGVAFYGENIIKDIVFYKYLSDSFRYKSKLVAHTVKCSD